MPTKVQKKLLKRWFREILEQGNLSTVEDLIDPYIAFYGQSGDPGLQGRSSFVIWLQRYRMMFSDQVWMIEDVIGENEKFVVRYSGYATYRGGISEIDSTNQRIFESGIFIFRLVNGRVREVWGETSDLKTMQQLGAFPSMHELGAILA